MLPCSTPPPIADAFIQLVVIVLFPLQYHCSEHPGCQQRANCCSQWCTCRWGLVIEPQEEQNEKLSGSDANLCQPALLCRLMCRCDALAEFQETVHNSSAQSKACDFLISKQRSDGGWAESYLSSQTKVHTTNCSSPEASLEASCHHSLGIACTHKLVSVVYTLPLDLTDVGATPTDFLDIYEVPLSCIDVYAAPMITQMLHHIRDLLCSETQGCIFHASLPAMAFFLSVRDCHCCK